MNSNSQTRFSLSSHSTKQQLPLQPLSKLNQEPSFSQRSFREKPSQKLLKTTDSFTSKAKLTKPSKAKENILDSRSTTISIVSKIPDEKDETLCVPSKAFRNKKTDHKTEKSFQDLNRSLANLALRRCVGRSSSDNDAICHITQTEADYNHRSYGGGFSNQYMETQPVFTLTSKTPYVNKKSFRGFQTSVQKGMEVTPFSFVNQNIENENQEGRRDISSKDLTLSDIDSGKLPGNDYRRDIKPTHNNHYLPFDTKVRTQGKNFITEGSYRMEFSNIDHLDNTDTQMCSQYNISNDIQLSYLNGDYCQEMGTDNLKDNELENQLEVVHHLSLRQDMSSKNKPASIQKKNPKQTQLSAQQNFRSTPAFKGVLRGKDLRNNLPYRNNLDSNPRRYSDLASIPRVTTGNMDRSLRATRENSEKIDLNNISDDVEYMMGGVGTNTRSKKQKLNIRNKSSFLASETNDTFPKQDGFESVRRETLDVWKQDIIKIKKEMESRKKSYAEVNKFVKLYDNETVVHKIRESRDSSFDMHATRKTSNISSVNVSRFEKVDNVKPYASGLKSLVTQESAKPVKQNRTKTSFDLKTAEDFDDQRSALGLPEDQSSAISRFRVQTTNPYYEYSNDPFETNNVFLYDKNVVLEKTQKQACCGSEKMCNMF